MLSQDQVDATAETQLPISPGEVRLNRLDADSHDGGDLRVAQPLADQLRHTSFSRREDIVAATVKACALGARQFGPANRTKLVKDFDGLV